MADRNLIPDFLKQRRTASDLADEEKRAIEDQNRIAALLIASGAPRFWRSLLEKLKIATDALPHVNLRGQFKPSLDERGVRISVNGTAPFVSQTYTDLYLDSRCIRCTELNIGFYNLEFRVGLESEIVVVDELGDGDPMDPDAAVKYIIERMMDHLVESSRSNATLSRRGL